MLNVEEHELLWFFEAEPRLTDLSDPDWFTNECVYEIRQDDLIMTFSIQPHQHDVRITLSNNGFQLFDFIATDIKDAQIGKAEKGEYIQGEVLQLIVDDEHQMIVQIKPQIKIFQVAFHLRG